MAVRRNLVTPRSGEPLVAAMQDFITGAYLLTHKDTFLTRTEVIRLAMQLMDKDNCSTRIELPMPTILKCVFLVRVTQKKSFDLQTTAVVDGQAAVRADSASTTDNEGGRRNAGAESTMPEQNAQTVT